MEIDGIRFDRPDTATPIAKDPVAMRLWNKLHDPLRAAGILTDLDIPAFEVLCQIYSKLQVERGHVFAELAMRFSNLLRQFGCTPSARKTMKVNLDVKDDDDDF